MAQGIAAGADDFMPKIAQRRNVHMIQQLNLDNVSPATRLLEKRRQMFEVQGALEAQKEEFARREELYKRREDALRKKDLELQESLIRFNKFLQENDSKRGRAEKKAADEIKLRMQKEGEIEKLKAELEQLYEKKETMKNVLEKQMCFQKYLESVLEETEDFSEIQELLMRYETLQATYEDLKASSKGTTAESDMLRNALAQNLKDQQDMKLKKHNEIALCQKELEVKEVETLRVAGKVERALEDTQQKKLELGKIRMAIENLYERCKSKRRAKVKLPQKTEEMEQLKVIGDYIVDLMSIAKGQTMVKAVAKKPG